jgi:hypothetical protein
MNQLEPVLKLLVQVHDTDVIHLKGSFQVQKN